MHPFKDTLSSRKSLLSKDQTKLHSFLQLFNHIPTNGQEECRCIQQKNMFWTNEKPSLMVAWSSLVSLSCFKAQSSIGHLVWFQ